MFNDVNASLLLVFKCCHFRVLFLRISKGGIGLPLPLHIYAREHSNICPKIGPEIRVCAILLNKNWFHL